MAIGTRGATTGGTMTVPDGCNDATTLVDDIIATTPGADMPMAAATDITTIEGALNELPKA